MHNVVNNSQVLQIEMQLVAAGTLCSVCSLIVLGVFRAGLTTNNWCPNLVCTLTVNFGSFLLPPKRHFVSSWCWSVEVQRMPTTEWHNRRLSTEPSHYLIKITCWAFLSHCWALGEPLLSYWSPLWRWQAMDHVHVSQPVILTPLPMLIISVHAFGWHRWKVNQTFYYFDRYFVNTPSHGRFICSANHYLVSTTIQFHFLLQSKVQHSWSDLPLHLIMILTHFDLGGLWSL